ncbi:MAG: histidine kinase N-terminal 7TM domain-containing protein [Myxococcota bacterium]|nr:PAS domain-containing protein [Myxococcales bacterium]
MAWDLGLLLATSVCVGIAIETVARRLWRDLASVPVLAVSAALWSGGELLLHQAGSPGEALAARRILFAGVCALGPVLLWTAARLHGPSARRAGAAAALAAGGVELVLYASLYGPHPESFIAGDPAGPTRGPLFFVHGAVQWTTLAVGLLLFATAAARVRAQRRATGWIVFAAIAFPLVVNWLYVGLDVPPRDPTPLAMAVTAVVLRWGVLDLVGAPFLAGLARSELMDQLDAAVLVADHRGRVLEVNRTGRALLGLDGARTERDLGELLAPFALDPGFDVRRFPLERRGLVVGQGVVVTDRRTAYEAERRADVATRVEALGLLAQGLSHEINNPITSIGIAAEFLGDRARMLGLRDPAEAAELDALIEVVATESERVAEIVRRMNKLAAVPREEGDAARTHVQAIARRAIDLLGLGKDPQRIRADVPTSPVHAAVRMEDLLQILLHLVSNALEADVEGRPVDVRVAADRDSVVIDVEDRGAGLGDVDPARLFDPFYTTKSPGRGVGLGLSLCWQLARQNGGHIEAAPREGGGTRLRLSLPRA